MSQQNILGLAKQGNPKAIAALLNRSLKPKGITAKAQLREGCLHILLESAQAPNQPALIALIRKGILRLGAESIKTVRVYWRQLGAESLAWTETIELKINDTRRPKPMPSEQVSLSPPLQFSDTSITQPFPPFQEERIEANPFIHLKARHLFLWAILISLLTGIGLVLLQLYSPLNAEDPIVSLLLIIWIDSWLYLWALGRFRQLDINPQRIIGNLPNNFLWLPMIGLVVALLLFSLGAFQLSHYFLSFFAPSFVESVLVQNRGLSASETAFPFLYHLLNIFVLVLVAPVTEELLFRGILLHRWTVKWSLVAALVVSSLIFGFLHANFVGLSVFGLVMALLYLNTGTLIVPIVCHGLNNAVAVVLGVLPLPSSTGETVSTLEQFRSNWWIGAVYVLLSAPWLIRFIYKTWPNQRSKLPYFTNAPQPRNPFAIANELLSNLNILADRPVRKSSSSQTSPGRKQRRSWQWGLMGIGSTVVLGLCLWGIVTIKPVLDSLEPVFNQSSRGNVDYYSISSVERLYTMSPTLESDDRVLIDKGAYGSKPVQRGDIILFNERYIMRVIGLPGETIEVKNGKVYLNNQRLEEGYITAEMPYQHDPVTVPSNSYFVLGDNRETYASDYREFVSQDSIRGQVISIYWPPSRARALD